MSAVALHPISQENCTGGFWGISQEQEVTEERRCSRGQGATKKRRCSQGPALARPRFRLAGYCVGCSQGRWVSLVRSLARQGRVAKRNGGGLLVDECGCVTPNLARELHWRVLGYLARAGGNGRAALLARAGSNERAALPARAGSNENAVSPASASTNAKPTSIPFGLHPKPKTPRISEPHHTNEKPKPFPAKRNLGIARAGSIEKAVSPASANTNANPTSIPFGLPPIRKQHAFPNLTAPPKNPNLFRPNGTSESQEEGGS